MDMSFINQRPGVDLLALLQIARIVGRGDDAESCVQDVLRHLAVSHRLVRGRVLIADPDTREIYIRYAHGLTPAEMERGRYRVGEGVTGRVFATGEAVLVADVHEDLGSLPCVEDPDAPPSEKIVYFAVPIVRDDLPLGVLAALCRPGPECSPQSHIALLEVIATLMASVLCVAGQSSPVVRPVVAPARACVAPPRPVARNDDQRRQCRDLTLRNAQQRHAEGRLHLAAGLYLEVVEQRPGTEQAEVATAKLMEIVRYHEGKGNPRLAADLLNRLRRVLEGSGGGAAGGHRPDFWGDAGPGSGYWDSFDDSKGSGGIGARVR